MNKIGKRGKANIESRKKIAEIAEDMNLTTCEVQLDGCMGTFGLAPAHRNKRDYYNGDVEKLSDPKQWVASCQACHEKMEKDRYLTALVFNILRGEEQ